MQAFKQLARQVHNTTRKSWASWQHLRAVLVAFHQLNLLAARPVTITSKSIYLHACLSLSLSLPKRLETRWCPASALVLGRMNGVNPLVSQQAALSPWGEVGHMWLLKSLPLTPKKQRRCTYIGENHPAWYHDGPMSSSVFWLADELMWMRSSPK